MKPDADIQDRTGKLVDEIVRLGPHLQKLADMFREPEIPGEMPPFDKWSGDSWRRSAFGDGYIRLRQLTEDNFHVLETLGLLATSRYVFELSVWLRLINQDSRYGLVYYWQLIDTQLRYYKDTAAHLMREVELLKSFHNEDDESSRDAIRRTLLNEDYPSLVKNLHYAISEVDFKASRKFSIYLDQAKVNGYGYQAYIVENRSLPKAEEAIREIEHEIREYKRNVSKDIQNLVKGRWQWRRMASSVGLESEHDYIYSYASKLLHATPASLMTDHKRLELEEMYLFARYIYAKMIEMMELARQQPEYRADA